MTGEEEIKALWDDFRTSKLYGNSHEQVKQNAVYGRAGDDAVEIEYWLGEKPDESNERRAGSPAWLIEIEPPRWFVRMVRREDIDIQEVLGRIARKRTEKKPCGAGR